MTEARPHLPEDVLPDPFEAQLGPRWLGWVLGGMIAALVLVKLHLVFLLNVNWDEFLYLSYLYRPLYGIPSQPLMSFHIELFPWLRGVGGGEIAQITVARLFIWGLAVASAALVWKISRRFFSVNASLYATLCALALTQTLDHGGSFRRDPLCAFFFLLATWLLVEGWTSRRARNLASAAAGLGMAASLLLTPKVVIHLATLGVVLLILLLRSRFARTAVERAVVFVGSFAAGFGGLFLFHRARLEAVTSSSQSYLEGVAGDVIGLQYLERGLDSLGFSAFTNPLIWTSLAAGALLLLPRLRRAERWEAALVLAFALPIASMLVYRNTYPYYFVFIFAPGVVLAAAAFDALVAGVGRRAPRYLGILTAVLAVAVFSNALVHYVRNTYDQQISQREHLELIHEIFPEPVPYLDRCSMVASFPKAGFFMSSWGMIRYQRSGQAVFSRVIREQEPKFVLGNVSSLVLAVANSSFSYPYRLVEDDARTLRQNFVHHWGALYVAGKTFRKVTARPRRFEMLIPGTYTVEARGPVLLDGVARQPGEALPLSQGWHTISVDDESGGEPQPVVLRWGDRLPRPARPPTPQALFKDF